MLKNQPEINYNIYFIEMSDLESHALLTEATKMQSLQMQALAEEGAKKVKQERTEQKEAEPVAPPSGQDMEVGFAVMEEQAMADEKPKKKGNT